MSFEYEYTNIKIGPLLYLAIPNIHSFSSVVIILIKNTQFSLVTADMEHWCTVSGVTLPVCRDHNVTCSVTCGPECAGIGHKRPGTNYRLLLDFSTFLLIHV